MPAAGPRALRCATALTAALLLAGCSWQPGEPRASEADQPDALASTPSTVPVQPPAAAQGHTDEDEELPPPEPYPTWDARARAQAVQAATTAMTAFARPQVDPARWWADLAPLLSPAGAVAYTGTDPAEVPARAVTGPAELVDQRSPYLAGVQVPTDTGPYLVLLSRDGGGAPWLVERLTPPPTPPVTPPSAPAAG